MTPRFWLLNSILAALIFAAWHAGFLMPLFHNDPTGMTYAIAALFVIGLASTARTCWARTTRLIIDTLPMLGLLGTFVGFAIAFSGVVGNDAVELRDLGIATALNTTICGVTGAAWLLWQVHLLRGKKS